MGFLAKVIIKLCFQGHIIIINHLCVVLETTQSDIIDQTYFYKLSPSVRLLVHVTVDEQYNREGSYN